MSYYWIFGKGGIGAALIDLLQGHNVEVFSRSNGIEFDCLEQCLASYTIPDYVIITTGFLHDEFTSPEKSIKQFNLDTFNKNLSGNLLPSLNICKYLTRNMPRNSNTIVVAFSARVGSISDNRLGGWYSYRMSKAALNMLVKNVSIEWKFSHPNACIIGYHPGTVATNLSKPFTQNAKNANLFTPVKAAKYCLQLLDSLTIEVSGNIYDWQKKLITP